MTIPPNPWFLKFLDGGNPKTYAIAAVAFALGYMWRGNSNDHWHHTSRSGDKHWRDEYGWHDDHRGKYTEKEHERENHRRGYERG